MDKKELLATQMTVLQLGRIASTLKLEEFITQMTDAEKAAPVLDPTLFKTAGDNLKALKKLATVLLPVASEFQIVFATMVKPKTPPEVVTK